MYKNPVSNSIIEIVNRRLFRNSIFFLNGVESVIGFDLDSAVGVKLLNRWTSSGWFYVSLPLVVKETVKFLFRSVFFINNTVFNHWFLPPSE